MADTNGNLRQTAYKAKRELVDIEHATVSDIDPAYAYKGHPIKPEPTVECGGRVLTKDEDYLLQYRDNVGSKSEASQASVTIVGIGRYRGSKVVTFTISARVSKPYRGAVVVAVAVITALMAAFLAAQMPGPPSNDDQSADSKVEVDPSSWHDVAAVCAGGSHIAALLKDGTAVATGNNEHGQCDVAGW